MALITYEEFKNSSSSEKIVLAHIEPAKRLVVWTLHSGSVYKKTVDEFIVNVSVDGTDLTEVFVVPTAAGQWYFDSENKELYVRATADADPDTVFTTGSIRLFFSNKDCSLPYDLGTGRTVPYIGAIEKINEATDKLDYEKIFTSIEGTGSLVIRNRENYFFGRIEEYSWDNRPIKLYSTSLKIPVTESRKIFEGLTTTKKFENEVLTINFNSFLYQFRSNLALPRYTDSDGVIPEAILNKPKRRVYGKVDGLSLDPTDFIKGNITASGTYSGVIDENIITTSGADLKNELTSGDSININGESYTVETLSNINIGLSGKAEVVLTASGTELEVYSTEIDNRLLTVSDHVVVSGPDISVDNRGIWGIKNIIDEVVVSDYTALAGDTLTVTLNGTPNSLVEGTDWTAATSNDATADSLRTAINNLTGITAADPPANIIEAIADTGYAAVISSSDPDNLEVKNTAFTLDKTNATPVTETLKVEANAIIACQSKDPDEITISDTIGATFSNNAINFESDLGYRFKNRKWYVTHHQCSEISTTISTVYTSSFIEVADGSDFNDNDIIDIDGNIRQIENVNGNYLTLATSLAGMAVSDSVKRYPIQGLYHKGDSFVVTRDYTITNNTTGTSITFNSSAEKNAIKTVAVYGSCEWYNNSKVVYSLAHSFAEIKPRDWLRPSASSTFYEVQEKISDSVVIIREKYTGTTVSQKTFLKAPKIIENDSIVSCDLYGVTDNGLKTGDLIDTCADIALHLVNEAFPNGSINTTSFSQSADIMPYMPSLAIPLQKLNNPPSYKTVIDLVNSSSLGSVYNDSNFNISYSILRAKKTSSTFFTDADIIDYKIAIANPNIVTTYISEYRFLDYNQDESDSSYSTESVKDQKFIYLGVVEKQKTIKVYLYYTDDVIALTQKRLAIDKSRTYILTANTNLKFIDSALNDYISFKLDRVFKRRGAESDNRIMGTITKLSKTQNGVTAEVNTLGETYYITGNIAENTAPSFTLSNDDEKSIYGYITDNNGVINDLEYSYGTNLIT